MNQLRRLAGQREFGIFAVIAANVVIMSFASPVF